LAQVLGLSEETSKGGQFKTRLPLIYHQSHLKIEDVE